MSEREEGKFEGRVLTELKAIKDYIKSNTERIECLEKKQERFSWYVGIAVGVGAFVMFIVDKIYDLIGKIK
jgi:hypothetical protein